MSDGAQQIAAERGRQIVSEQFTVEYDLIAGGAEPLTKAAVIYAEAALDSIAGIFPPAEVTTRGWPWPRQAFKPSTAKRDLVKAGALIAAAIDQLDLAER